MSSLRANQHLCTAGIYTGYLRHTRHVRNEGYTKHIKHAGPARYEYTQEVLLHNPGTA